MPRTTNRISDEELEECAEKCQRTLDMGNTSFANDAILDLRDARAEVEQLHRELKVSELVNKRLRTSWREDTEELKAEVERLQRQHLRDIELRKAVDQLLFAPYPDTPEHRRLSKAYDMLHEDEVPPDDALRASDEETTDAD